MKREYLKQKLLFGYYVIVWWSFSPSFPMNAMTSSGFSVELLYNIPLGSYGAFLPSIIFGLKRNLLTAYSISLLHLKACSLLSSGWLQCWLSLPALLCALKLRPAEHAKILWGMQQSAFSPESGYTVLQPAPCEKTSSLLPSLSCTLKKYSM